MQKKLPKLTIASPEANKDDMTVLCEKTVHKGFFHMLAESGGLIAFSDTSLFAVRIVPMNDKFNAVQIVTQGKQGATMKSNAYQRSKAAVKSKKPQKKVKSIEIKDEGVDEI
jgi:hypothetical protein